MGGARAGFWIGGGRGDAGAPYIAILSDRAAAPVLPRPGEPAVRVLGHHRAVQIAGDAQRRLVDLEAR